MTDMPGVCGREPMVPLASWPSGLGRSPAHTAQECVAEKHKVEDFQIGARDVVKAAFTVARACMEDMELGSSTLKVEPRCSLVARDTSGYHCHF